MSYNLPNPSLVGILLAVSTHNGPQIAFSYPEDLATRSLRGEETASEGDIVDDEDYEIDLDAVRESENPSDGDASTPNGSVHRPMEGDTVQDTYIDGTNSGQRKHKTSEEFRHDIHHDIHHEYTQMQAQHERQWDASDPSYYLGTKLDIMSFLDARERHRRARSQEITNGKNSKSSSPLLAAGVCDFASKTKNSSSPMGQTQTQSGSGSGPSSASEQAAKPDKIFGFEPEQLGEMLCPPRAMCNRRFDVMLEKTVFLGLPVHVCADGAWRASKKRRNLTATATATATGTTSGRKPAREPKSDHSEDGPSGGASGEPTVGENKVNSAKSSDGPPEAAPNNADAGTDADLDANGSEPGTPMSMFHLVFVMSPPDIERNYRVDEMFYNVAAKLALILRHEQHKHDYVWGQVREILRLKEAHRTAQGPWSEKGKGKREGKGEREGEGKREGERERERENPYPEAESDTKTEKKTEMEMEIPSDSSTPQNPTLRPAASLACELVARVPLCRVIADCYTAISASQIANLIVNQTLRSLQIPLKTEFHSVPEPTVPYMPGSGLSSTINCLGSAGRVHVGETARYSLVSQEGRRSDSRSGDENSKIHKTHSNDDDADDPDDDNDDNGVDANPDNIVHLALLLCDEPENIVRDLQAEVGSAIAQFVRMLRPTESLLAMCNRLREHSHGEPRFSVAEARALAVHLVYWRRARVVAPLSTRAVYIVSPMAPLSTTFHDDIVAFSRQFPTVPSLPSFLKSLSTRSRKPRQFAAIVPSKDHKEMYLSALAWLVRHGYATQLHTYIWLKVSKKVKMKVEAEMEEELGRTRAGKKRGNVDGDMDIDSDMARSRSRSRPQAAVDNSSKQTQPESAGAKTGIETEIETESKISGLASSELDALRRRVPEIVLEDDGDTILVDPGRASSLERRWINKIIHEECHLSPELTAVFYTILKYMNGRNSLELLLLRENISRSELRRLLSEIDDYIISVRHW